MFGFPFQLVQSFSLQLLRTATADTVERADFRGSVGRVEPRTLCDRTCTLQCSSFSWLLAMTKNLCSEQKILFTRNLDEIQQPQILLFLKIPQRNTFPQHLFFTLPCLLPTLFEFLPGICRMGRPSNPRNNSNEIFQNRGSKGSRRNTPCLPLHKCLHQLFMPVG